MPFDTMECFIGARFPRWVDIQRRTRSMIIVLVVFLKDENIRSIVLRHALSSVSLEFFTRVGTVSSL